MAMQAMQSSAMSINGLTLSSCYIFVLLFLPPRPLQHPVAIRQLGQLRTQQLSNPDGLTDGLSINCYGKGLIATFDKSP